MLGFKLILLVLGNHLCVSVINNYIPRSEVDYYAVPQGFEKEPKLSPTLAGPVHKFAMQVSCFPILIWGISKSKEIKNIYMD